MSEVLEVADFDFVLESYEWDFAREHASVIAAYWEERRTRTPALFNGRVLLQSRREFVTRPDGRLTLRGAYFQTDYAHFLAWRGSGLPHKNVCDCFAMAALRSADGAYLLGEMGPHTANAGRVYFPAGTPDMDDVIDGKVDLGASVLRELREETGVAPNEATIDPGWVVVHAPPMIACMKIVRSPLTALALQTRIHDFLASEKEPELARMHIARSVGDVDGLSVSPFVLDFLTRTFDPRTRFAPVD